LECGKWTRSRPHELPSLSLRTRAPRPHGPSNKLPGQSRRLAGVCQSGEEAPAQPPRLPAQDDRGLADVSGSFHIAPWRPAPMAVRSLAHPTTQGLDRTPTHAQRRASNWSPGASSRTRGSAVVLAASKRPWAIRESASIRPVTFWARPKSESTSTVSPGSSPATSSSSGSDSNVAWGKCTPAIGASGNPRPRALGHLGKADPRAQLERIGRPTCSRRPGRDGLTQPSLGSSWPARPSNWAR
jgi:hypothetical protein